MHRAQEIERLAQRERHEPGETRRREHDAVEATAFGFDALGERRVVLGRGAFQVERIDRGFGRAGGGEPSYSFSSGFTRRPSSTTLAPPAAAARCGGATDATGRARDGTTRSRSVPLRG